MNKNLKFVCIGILIGMFVASPFEVFALQSKRFQIVRKYENQFSDIKPSDWFFHAVKKAYMMNLVNGRSSSCFAPKENVDVSEVITIASRIHSMYHGKKISEGKNDNIWYKSYVDYAIANGLIKNYEFNARYDRPATRGETAYIMSGSLPKSEFKAKTERQIPDVSSATKHHKEIYLLFQAGVIEGKDLAGAFRPNENILRSEVAMVAVKVICEEERLADRPFMVRALEETDLNKEAEVKQGDGESSLRDMIVQEVQGSQSSPVEVQEGSSE